ncbi:MAG: hypothetical protein QXH91_07570 [Candidatus Bathyarchaeia archaeon]
MNIAEPFICVYRQNFYRVKTDNSLGNIMGNGGKGEEEKKKKYYYYQKKEKKAKEVKKK